MSLFWPIRNSGQDRPSENKCKTEAIQNRSLRAHVLIVKLLWSERSPCNNKTLPVYILQLHGILEPSGSSVGRDKFKVPITRDSG